MRSPVTFGRYLLLERISVGGMAEVFKAKTFGVEGFEKILAIKRILPSMADDQDFVTMFIDEAKIAGQLSHANICQIFELGRIDASHFIAMEYIRGKDVLQIQNRFRRLGQRMPLPMAALIAAKVCEGLDYAHRKRDADDQAMNIVHRDVSPQNLLVSYEGEVKIIDFGIAKAVSRSVKTKAGVLKGKFGYMSPEQVRGQAVDRRSDLFALGTVLWEMCTGERLFTGSSDLVVLDKVRHATVPRPSLHNPEVPPELEMIIMRALRREPEERFQWASEVQHALRGYLDRLGQPWSTSTLSTQVKAMFEQELQREQAALERFARIPWNEQLASQRHEVVDAQDRPATDVDIAAETISEVDRAGPRISHVATALDLALEQGSYDEGATQISGSPFDSEADDVDDLAPASGHAVGSELVATDSSEELTSSAILAVTTGEDPDDGADDSATRVFGEPAHQSAAATDDPTHILQSTTDGNAGLADDSEGVRSGGPDAWQHQQPPSSGNGHLRERWPADDARVIYDDASRQVMAPPTQGEVASSTGHVVMPGRWTRTALGLVIVAAFIGGVVVLSWLLLDRKPDQRPATLMISALLSEPAQVFLDGELKGKLEPGTRLTVKGIRPGTHRVTVLTEGADPIISSVDLIPGEIEVLSLAPQAEGPAAEPGPGPQGQELASSDDAGSGAVPEPAQTLGKLTIRTEPPDATVLLDGLHRGRTPLSLDDVAAGSHRLELRSRGFEAAEVSVTVDAARESEVDLVLRRLKPSSAGPATRGSRSGRPKIRSEVARTDREPAQVGEGFLVANTTPWAKVLIDGQDSGRMTPIVPRSKLALKAGRRMVTFVVGAQRFNFRVVVKPGETVRLIQTLPVE